MNDENAAAGWYPTDDGERYWDGSAWTKKFRTEGQRPSVPSPDTETDLGGPAMYFVYGFLTWLAGLGVLALTAISEQDELIVLVWVIVMIGWIFILIGVIAQGVVVGLRTARRPPDRESPSSQAVQE